MTRRVGCGLESLEISTGYLYYATVFDSRTGELVGAASASDAQFGPCMAHSYDGGRLLARCNEAVVYACDPTVSDAGPLDGCRAPSDPGCATCCLYDPSAKVCYEYQAVSGTNEYHKTSGTFGACRVSCAACARCSRAEEALLRADPPPG